jgi:hypothetical protein
VAVPLIKDFVSHPNETLLFQVGWSAAHHRTKFVWEAGGLASWAGNSEDPVSPGLSLGGLPRV